MNKRKNKTVPKRLSKGPAVRGKQLAPPRRASRDALLNGGEVALYRPKGGSVRLDVRLERDTVWLSLNQMADLFGRDNSVISRHLQNIYKSRELQRSATVAKNATVQMWAGNHFRKGNSWRRTTAK